MSAGAPGSPIEAPRPADVLAGSRGRDLEGIEHEDLGFLSLQDMLSELLERIRSSLAVDTAAVLLLDEDRGVLVARAARGLEEEVRQGVQIPLAPRGFAGRIASERRPFVIEDLEHTEVVNPILRQKGIRSMLGVPVQVEGRVIGVMHIGTLRRREFDADDVTLLQLAADRAAVAIDNARLAEARAVTETMQRTLLPDELPDLPGLRFSAKYLPAGSGIKVGGDWYDVFQLSSGSVALVIGDVVGRGVLAASVMAEIRTSLRAYLMEGHGVSHAVDLLNELLVTMGRNRGATLSVFALDLEQGELETLGAGHLPPIMVDADGRARLLEQPAGLPVTGSTLLLYTDGRIERRGEPIDEGLNRLAAAAEDAARRSDSSFADRVYRTLLEDTPLDDDVALLAIESLALDAALEVTLPARPGVVAGLRSALGRWLTEAGASEGDLFDITLSTSEAATNAVEHAYGARDATFTVRCKRDGRDVEITVVDDGRWRTVRARGGGRGLEIMRGLMDTVEIHRTDTGTAVTMTKRLSDPD